MRACLGSDSAMTGDASRIQITNRFFIGTDGIAHMTFERRFHFPGVERCFEAMQYDAKADAILDALGRRRHPLVELVRTIEDGAVTPRSRRQWLTPFGLPIRICLPRFLAGEVTIEEWPGSETSLGIRVAISNRLFGAFFGYKGTFERTDGVADKVRRVVAASTLDRHLSGVARVALSGCACWEQQPTERALGVVPFRMGQGSGTPVSP
jgi:hypothetical protein